MKKERFVTFMVFAQETTGTKISRSGHIDLAGGTRHYVAEGSGGPR
jgi:hypothetical protein